MLHLGTDVMLDMLPLVDDAFDSNNELSDRSGIVYRRILHAAINVAKANRGDAYTGENIIWHSEEEMRFLYDFVTQCVSNESEGYILQCGIFCGGSACMLASACRDMKYKWYPVLAIDNFYSSAPLPSKPGIQPRLIDFAATESRLSLLTHDLMPYLHLVQADDCQFISSFWTKPVQFAFVDSSHLYEHTLQEIQLLVPHISSNGMLLFHDYWNPELGVGTAVNEFFRAYRDRTVYAYSFKQRFVIIKFDSQLRLAGFKS